MTAIFWIAWAIISFWVLKTYYFSSSKTKLEQLCQTSIGIHLAILVIAFLPWSPPIIFVVLLLISIALSFSKIPKLLKLAAITSVSNTFLLFISMYQRQPKTFVLTSHDIAPIISLLLLLTVDVVVLLLWQQLQLLEKSRR